MLAVSVVWVLGIACTMVLGMVTVAIGVSWGLHMGTDERDKHRTDIGMRLEYGGTTNRLWCLDAVLCLSYVSAVLQIDVCMYLTVCSETANTSSSTYHYILHPFAIISISLSRHVDTLPAPPVPSLPHSFKSATLSA
jgi:hypothetical protein